MLLFAVIAIKDGIGGPSLPEGDVLFVEDVSGGGVDLSQYETAFEQSWRRAGLPGAPARNNEQYQSIQEAAIADLLDQIWLRGEAASLDVRASGREIRNELQTIQDTQFPNKKAYQKFLRDSGFTEEEVLDRVRLQILSRKIEERVRADAPGPTEDQVEQFYEASLEQYTTPEEQRFILISAANKQDARTIEKSIENDPSPKNFSRLARRYSDDPSSSQGGRTSTSRSTYPPDLQEEIQSAEDGSWRGPIEATVGGEEKTYFFFLEETIPEKVEPLDTVREEILEQLRQVTEQTALEDFIEDYQTLWVSRTVCAEGFITDRCSNYQTPSFSQQADPACTDPEALKKEPSPDCPAPVLSRSSQNPGAASQQDPFGNPLQEALPQGPVLPAGTPSNTP